MMRIIALACTIVMSFSIVAGARNRHVDPRQRMLMQLRWGHLQHALETANELLGPEQGCRTQPREMNIILREHARAMAERNDGLFSDALAANVAALCVQHIESDADDLVAIHNLGYILLHGIGSQPDTRRAINLLQTSLTKGLQQTFVLVDTRIFNVAPPGLQILAQSLFEKIDWEKHPALQSWIATHLGLPAQATIKHPTKGLFCVENGSCFRRL